MFNPNDTQWDDKVSDSYGFPDGEHVTFISDVGVGFSNSGTPYVELEFTCHDPASKSRNKSQRFEKFWTSEKALPRLVRLCRAAGVVKSFDLGDESSVQDALLDRLVRVEVKTKPDTYQGVTRMRSEVSKASRLKDSEKARLIAEYGETMLPALKDGDESLDDVAPF